MSGGGRERRVRGEEERTRLKQTNKMEIESMVRMRESCGWMEEEEK
jgi:hypothetical protein